MNWHTIALATALSFCAGATSVLPLPVTQQAQKAEIIVRARIGVPKTVKDSLNSWVAYPLVVSEVVAGELSKLPTFEGEPTLYVLANLQDGPPIRQGQEAFLLLYSTKLDSPFVGFNQGIFPIENNQVTRPGEKLPTTTQTSTSTTNTAAASSPSAATTPDKPTADAIQRDPNKFRDELKAARGGK